MCGFAGIAHSDARPVDENTLRRMGASLWHRGPDDFGVHISEHAGLAHVRLSIIDLEGGAQPLGNEDSSVVIAYDGEVYNYIELRKELERYGHRFRTRSDTEVLVHAYEQWGTRMTERLNGQFAFAIYDRRSGSMMLARDRFGVRPLFYAERGGSLYFGSEIKAILASGDVPAEPDLKGFDEVFTFWGARAPRTPFIGVCSLEPGTHALWRDGTLRIARYYYLDFPESTSEPGDALERLDDLMRSAVRLRMRADVPVGGYLSGGLDSSITCMLAAAQSAYTFRTFSVTFADPRFDESEHQQVIASALGSSHLVQPIGAREIALVFPAVVRHAETPLVRTAPAPMFLLARLAREHGTKVVLSGEGADELFLGYDLFKETMVRLFCLRRPESRVRPRLFDRLYPYRADGGRGGEFWRRYILGAGSASDPLFSHLPRFLLTSRIKDFYTRDVQAELADFDPLDELRASLPDAFHTWSPENRAAHLEMVTLLASYLLSSQGDRMAKAHGIEGRFPFLDHRLFEFAASLPARSKLQGLREKAILRRWARDVVPPSAAYRPKQPYRAPDAPAFFGPGQPDYVRELLDEPSLRAAGIFQPRAVAGLLRRCQAGKVTGFAENQTLVAILSTQLWFQEFMNGTAKPHYHLLPARIPLGAKREMLMSPLMSV